MDEWRIFLAFGEIAALFFLVGKPIIALNTTMSILSATLAALKKDLDDQKAKASTTHKEFYKHFDVHDRELQDHEHRIKHLEENN